MGIFFPAILSFRGVVDWNEIAAFTNRFAAASHKLVDFVDQSIAAINRSGSLRNDCFRGLLE